MIRAWQLEFCERNYCAAALLSFFEYHHNALLANERRKDDIQNHTAKELAAGLLGLYQRDAIREARELLCRKGAIRELNSAGSHSNDQTMGFEFLPDVLNEWISGKVPVAENRISDAENRNCSDAENRISLNNVFKEEEKEDREYALSTPLPSPGGSSLPQCDFSVFRKNYPFHKMRGNESAAKEAWQELSPSPEEAFRIVQCLQILVRSKSWTDEAGQFVPLPHKFLRSRRWEAMDGGPSENSKRIYGAFIEITGDARGYHELTDRRAKFLDERWQDALRKSSTHDEAGATQILRDVIEAACESHEKRHVPKRLTIESIFETTEKMERWLAEDYA